MEKTVTTEKEVINDTVSIDVVSTVWRKKKQPSSRTPHRRRVRREENCRSLSCERPHALSHPLVLILAKGQYLRAKQKPFETLYSPVLGATKPSTLFK